MILYFWTHLYFRWNNRLRSCDDKQRLTRKLQVCVGRWEKEDEGITNLKQIWDAIRLDSEGTESIRLNHTPVDNGFIIVKKIPKARKGRKAPHQRVPYPHAGFYTFCGLNTLALTKRVRYKPLNISVNNNAFIKDLLQNEIASTWGYVTRCASS